MLEIGTIPLLLNTPIVGFNPTTEFKLDGEVIEPEVSVPTAATAKFAATVTPLPAELPPVSNFPLPYGFNVCPPTAEYPNGQPEQKKYAHSLRFTFPKINAPFALNFSTIKASSVFLFSTNAIAPAVVGISFVLILSFNKMGIPYIEYSEFVFFSLSF